MNSLEFKTFTTLKGHKYRKKFRLSVVLIAIYGTIFLEEHSVVLMDEDNTPPRVWMTPFCRGVRVCGPLPNIELLGSMNVSRGYGRTHQRQERQDRNSVNSSLIRRDRVFLDTTKEQYMETNGTNTKLPRIS